jgi:glycosyltransferase involved in cell wall biosynthesis
MALRGYRHNLFSILSKRHPIRFFFSSSDETRFPDADYSVIKDRYEVLQEYPSPFFMDGFAPSIIPRLITYRPDIIIASTFSSFFTYIAFLYSKITRTPIVVFSEDWCRAGGLLSRVMYPFTKTLIRSADAIVAAGSLSTRYLKSIGAKRVFKGVNTASDLSEIKIDSEKLNRFRMKYADKKIILYLSRIVKYKGLDTLIEAFASSSCKHPDWFLIIGGDGPFSDYCKKLAEEKEITNYEFLGQIEQNDMIYYYYLCDVFVLPSKFMPDSRNSAEAWGMVINEAMSLGKPVISTDAVAAAFDLIRDGWNGKRVRSDDPLILYHALDEALDHPEWGQNSRQLISYLSPEKQANAFSSAIKYVTGTTYRKSTNQSN